MGVLLYFLFMASLPTAKETSLRDIVVQSANIAILHEVQRAKMPRKRKAYTAFTAEQKVALEDMLPSMEA